MQKDSGADSAKLIPVLFPRYDSPAGSQDVRTRFEATQNAILVVAEGLLAVDLEDLAYRTAEAVLEQDVGIDKWAPRQLGDSSSERRFTRSHHP